MSGGFDPTKHLTTVGRGDRAKRYLPVAARLLWLVDTTARYTIEPELIDITDVAALARATVTIFDADGAVLRRVTDFKQESRTDFGDFIEKAVTGAIGRALAQLGFGTQFATELVDDAATDAPEAAAAAPRPAPPRGKPAIPTDWNTFWPWAKVHGLPGKRAVEEAIDRPLAGLGVEELVDLVSQALAGQGFGEPTTPPPDPRANAAARPGAPVARQPTLPSAPITTDEASLINFKERAEAGDDFASLLTEAAGDIARLAALAAYAPTLAALEAVVAAAKRQGKYGQPLITTERKQRDYLARRAASFTN